VNLFGPALRPQIVLPEFGTARSFLRVTFAAQHYAVEIERAEYATFRACGILINLQGLVTEAGFFRFFVHGREIGA
jgi:hypothetical protein